MNNITIPEFTTEILVKVSIFYNGNYYNPYFFLPINNEECNEQERLVKRAISYIIKNNCINLLWLYFTKEHIHNIISTQFQPEDSPIDNIEYIKEYYLD